MKTYVLFLFHAQINMKGNIAAILTFTQFTPMYVPQNLENEPAQVSTQLRHCKQLHIKTQKHSCQTYLCLRYVEIKEGIYIKKKKI